MSQYEPNGSNYHDHLCTCPGCNPQPPDPSEEEIAGYEFAQAIRVAEGKYRKGQVLALRDAGVLRMEHHRRRMPLDEAEQLLYSFYRNTLTNKIAPKGE